MGLGVNPNMVKASEWLPDLFGDANFDDVAVMDSCTQGLFAFYNDCMRRVMEFELKLPAACKLSKTDMASSLDDGAPLPSYCSGLLKALKKINKRSLRSGQTLLLERLTHVATGFTSLRAAKEIFKPLAECYPFERQAMDARRNFTRMLGDAIYEIRFGEEFMPPGQAEWDDDREDPFPGEPDEQDEVYQMLDALMSIESREPIEPISKLINFMEEEQITPEFKQENHGHFWGIHETRPYMTLRSRRAYLNFHYGDKTQAVEELEDLLYLNPMDNQANRYLLANAYITTQNWDGLENLLTEMPEESMFDACSRSLLIYAKQGDSPAAKAEKARLKSLNKHCAKMLTGQMKVKDAQPEMYSPGSKEEVATYMTFGGKQAWLSVEGSLFWLRR